VVAPLVQPGLADLLGGRVRGWLRRGCWFQPWGPRPARTPLPRALVLGSGPVGQPVAIQRSCAKYDMLPPGDAAARP